MAITTERRELTPELVRRSLEGKRLSWVDILIQLLLLVALLSSLLILAVLLIDVIRTAWPVFAARGLSFITTPLSPDPAQSGILQGIMGSLALTGIVIVVAFPLGVGAAIYLEEYAKDSVLSRLLVANIRNLAGVPSIVYGLLGLAVFVQAMAGVTNGRTVIAGGLTLAVLVIPIMIITTQEALRAVPQALREASFGVGATKWETIRHHVLPVAMPAVLTGSVLTIARAFGEAAPLLLAGALVTNFFQVSAGASFVDLITVEPYTALPVVIFNWSRQPQPDFQALTAAGILVLLVLLLIINAVAIILRDRYARRS